MKYKWCWCPERIQDLSEGADPVFSLFKVNPPPPPRLITKMGALGWVKWEFKRPSLGRRGHGSPMVAHDISVGTSNSRICGVFFRTRYSTKPLCVQQPGLQINMRLYYHQKLSSVRARKISDIATENSNGKRWHVTTTRRHETLLPDMWNPKCISGFFQPKGLFLQTTHFFSKNRDVLVCVSDIWVWSPTAHLLPNNRPCCSKKQPRETERHTEHECASQFVPEVILRSGDPCLKAASHLMTESANKSTVLWPPLTQCYHLMRSFII